MATGAGLCRFTPNGSQSPVGTARVASLIDDQDTPTIFWPNYHSGSNGDFQRIAAVEPVHELLFNS